MEPSNFIAITGMAGRFPGADNVREFWGNARGAVTSITHFSAEELEDAFSEETRASDRFVRARGIIRDVDQFDAEFFGMRPREAALTDPQHRLLLECAWSALEDSGCDPSRYPGPIGVFAGCSMNTYMLTSVLADRAAVERFASDYQVGSYDTLMGALADTLATRLAYKLNLRGPAMTVQSACSTSLLAVAQACQNLLLYQCDMALAGGVSIAFPQKRGYLHQDGGMVSADGACRPFDAAASGTVFADGCAMVVLKRLEDAVEDGDHIYAVVRGWAVNNDGSDKVGFTAPSVQGQAAVIASALAAADVDPRTIGYVECHGTATPLGDPIEFAGLVKAFGQQHVDRPSCALGSAKANVGHMDVAAGVGGLIRAALALHHREIPPLANFRSPNPHISLSGSPFYIPDKPLAWERGKTPRRAGVSALGVGGTNVHVVLEEAPQRASVIARERAFRVLPLSARSEAALARLSENLATALESDPDLALADVAHTLQAGRRRFAVRRAVVCRGDGRNAAVQLRQPGGTLRAAGDGVAPIVFMFPGQGAQHAGMGRAIYDEDAGFRSDIDRGAALLEPLIGQDLRQVMFAADSDEALTSTLLAQTSLFLLEYALARLWMRWGVKPDAMIGHSLGEFTAACIAGVFSFEDGLALVAARARLMQAMPPGAMLAMRLPEGEARALMGEMLDLAAVNAPSLCVASGPDEAIGALERELIGRRVGCVRLNTSHAFHSRAMDAVVKPLEAVVCGISLAPASIPYASCLTGAWSDAAQQTAPHYWASHCSQPVRFADALATVVSDRQPILLEVGPGRTLSMLAAQTRDRKAIRTTVASLPGAQESADPRRQMAQAVGEIWKHGAPIDWSAVNPGGARTPLPTYPFERRRHWIDPPARAATPPRSGAEESAVTTPASPEAACDRRAQAQVAVIGLLEALWGDTIEAIDPNATFLELGFDSLFLGQVAQALDAKFGLSITFRQLLSDTPSIAAVAALLESKLPDAPRDALPPSPASKAAPGDMQALFAMQAQAMQELFAEQLRALHASGAAPAQPASPPIAAPAEPEAPSRKGPVTEPQMEVWLAAQFGPAASCAFNESLTLTISGPLDPSCMAGALNDVIARHDALRSRFLIDGESFEVLPALTLPLDLHEAHSEAAAEAILAGIIAREARTPFDLGNGPLVRASLVRLAPERHALVLTAHHIVCDGWSFNVILDEIAACYRARRSGVPHGLPVPMSFAQHAIDANARVPIRAERYWLQQYADNPALPPLPTDRSSPPQRSFGGDTYTAHFDAAFLKALKQAGARHGATLFTTLLAGLQALAGRLASHNDIIVAVPTAGQSLLGNRVLVGHCVNFLPIRAPFDWSTRFSDHLVVLQRRVLDAYEHQDYTYGALLRKLQPPRTHRLPLTKIQFNLERLSTQLDFSGAVGVSTPNPKASTNFDIHLNCIESAEGLRIDCDYNTDVLDRATIARWIGHYRTLLEGAIADASLDIAHLPLLSGEEKTWQIDALNATAAPRIPGERVDALIAERAAMRGEATACIDAAAALSYAELEARANRLARQIERAAPGGGKRVAVALARSCDLIVALLAVLKSGHAYVPLDPDLPPARVQQILQEADVAVHLCGDAAGAALAPPNALALRLDRLSLDEGDASPLPARHAADDAPAYVIFTSGTTGRPKGVEVSHGALANFLTSMIERPGFTARDTMVAVTTISFDIAALELFAPLVAGGRVVIATRDAVRDGYALVKLIDEHRATIVQATPSLWKLLLEAGFTPRADLRMLCGGEALPRDLADRLLSGGPLWNLYGPTETTIWSAVGSVAAEGPIVIGAPIANTQLYILDERDQLAPVGAVGVLHIGGMGLANGYFRQPELTQRAFRTLSIAGRPPQRLYNTGDLARRLPSGDIQVLGRADAQVKLRGFRIELEEIEIALRNAPGVQSCAVALRNDIGAEPALAAYYVASQQLDAAALAAFVRARLPDYMTPSHWMRLERLPLSPSGKLDRKALPAPTLERAPQKPRASATARTPLEAQIAAVWESVLGRETIDLNDPIFALGADSLQIFRIAARLNKQGIAVEARELMKNPSVAELAKRLEGAQPEAHEAPVRRGPSLADFRHGARRQGVPS